MKIVCFPALILLSSLQLLTSVTGFSKRSLSSKDVLRLLQEESSIHNRERVTFFDIDELPDLNVHKQGQSWLDRYLVEREVLTDDERTRGKFLFSQWLTWWGVAWPWIKKPYNLSQIPIIRQLIEAYAQHLDNVAPQQQRNLETAIQNAEKQIFNIPTTSLKGIDIHTVFIGVLAAITGAGKHQEDLSATNTVSRQYLSEKDTLARITIHLADEANLKTLVHNLCDLLRPT